MAKTLKDFLEGYLKVKSADEQKFIDKHVTAKNPDRNGNGDDVFKGSTKTIDRRKDRKGYNPGEDEKVYEALKGKQHKIDANKNGKVDAHDFKLLRKKKVAEETEQLDELSPSTMGSYAKKAAADFKARKPKMGYDGQLKKMQNRSVGVERAVKKVYGEEAEQIDEAMTPLEKAQRKHDRAKKELDDASEFVKGGSHIGGKGSNYSEVPAFSPAKASKYLSPYIERHHNAKRELAKVKKTSGIAEEAEQIDELDQKLGGTLSRYINKTRGDDKREAGRNLALKKRWGDAKYGLPEPKVKAAVREEVEELDEKLTAKTPMGTYIKDFKKSDAPQFKGKSQDKRRVMAIAAKLSAERGGKPLRKEERLQNRINDLTETHQRTLMHVFEKLNEDNKSKFLEACETPDGVEQMLDFAINNRGE